jgi:hypothetical protein
MGAYDSNHLRLNCTTATRSHIVCVPAPGTSTNASIAAPTAAATLPFAAHTPATVSPTTATTITDPTPAATIATRAPQ